MFPSLTRSAEADLKKTRELRAEEAASLASEEKELMEIVDCLEPTCVSWSFL
jgi:hypothetical protein